MIDAANIQAMAAFGAMLLAQLTLMGGWTWWLVRNSEGSLREEMRRNHRELLTLLQYYTHGEDGAAVFHRLPDGAGN